jgi:hypothetical protein
MIEFTLIYQILVLLMLGVQIGLLSHLVRRNIHPKQESLAVSQGDTNVSLKTNVHQGDRNVTVPPLNINVPLQEEKQLQPQIPQQVPIIPTVPRPNFTPYAQN